jgi:hypothetical protein
MLVAVVALATVAQVNALPVHDKNVFVPLAAVIKLVVSAAVLYGICKFAPPAMLVDLPAEVAVVAVVAEPAVKLAAVPEKFVAVNVGLDALLTS